jgi:uncharacterized protein YbbC (DUF1343 family)
MKANHIYKTILPLLVFSLMTACKPSDEPAIQTLPEHKTSSNTPVSSNTDIVSTLSSRVYLGNETLSAQDYEVLKGKRIGLLTNPSGVDSSGQMTVDVFHSAQNVDLVALFACEHGIYGDINAGKEFRDHIDPKTGLQVFSLYGPGPIRAPTPAMLEKIDAMVYDLQDTGCRSYTFIATMGAAMEACAKEGKEFIILDRPNPLGGLRVEGNRLSPEILKLRSLVARWDIPYTYGMTVGELARMINGEGWISQPCNLTIVPMAGWRRDMVWKDTDLPWVPTSPNVRTANSSLYYVSTGILGELGGVRIGKEFGRTFEIITAPWLDADSFATRMNNFELKGVTFVPFKQQYQKYLQQGVEIIYTDPARAPLTALNFYLIEGIRQETGRDLFQMAVQRGSSWKMFDKVNGTTETRKALQQRKSASESVASWQADEMQFQQIRKKYLIYSE